MASSEAIRLEIVTPGQSLVNTVCDKVSIPGYKGELEVLQSHTELLSMLVSGLVKYHHQGQEYKVAVKAGFLQVNQDHIRLLADDAKMHNDIDQATLKTQMEKIEEQLVSEKVGMEEREGLFAERDWLQALAQL